MGCDIHMVVERRVSAGSGGDGTTLALAPSWRRALPPLEAQDPWLRSQAREFPDDSWYRTRSEVTWYDGRNYNLFAVLAGVRNGIGVAGICTGNPVVPIAEPRGLPDDLSPEVQKLLRSEDSNDDIWIGDHSHSWLLLSEILAYDWDQPKHHVGVVSLDQFTQRIAEHGYDLPVLVSSSPYLEWRGAISGRQVRTYKAGVVIQALQNGGFRHPGDETPYVRDVWTAPLRASMGDFLTRTVPALCELDANPDNVRIVFGFDS